MVGSAVGSVDGGGGLATRTVLLSSRFSLSISLVCFRTVCSADSASDRARTSCVSLALMLSTSRVWSSMSWAFWFWSSVIWDVNLFFSERRSSVVRCNLSLSDRSSSSSARSGAVTPAGAETGAGTDSDAGVGLPKGRPARPRPNLGAGAASSS